MNDGISVCLFATITDLNFRTYRFVYHDVFDVKVSMGETFLVKYLHCIDNLSKKISTVSFCVGLYSSEIVWKLFPWRGEYLVHEKA